MGYTSESKNRRWGLPVGLLALILMMVLIGTATAPTPALAVAITCGGCHGNAGTGSAMPSDSDSGCKQTTKNHPDHASTTDNTACNRCHPAVAGPKGVATAIHNNNYINVTTTKNAVGMRYYTAGTYCSNACHKNEPNPVWGGSRADCNLCHFRSGAIGSVALSGLHVTSDRSYMHYSSAIKVIDNTKTITCNNCHPAVPFANNTTYPRKHIATPYTNNTGFANRGNMSKAHTYVNVTSVGYIKGATAAAGKCSLSCHYNATDPFGNYTIHFKPGQKKRFGPYSTARWGSSDLKCNECHSTPSQEASFGGASSINANKRHESHMFRYKLNPWNFQNEDRNIYCDDCHRTPDINATRGFLHHSTIGRGNSGIISLPVKSENAKVYLKWRNNGIGRNGTSEPVYNRPTSTCDNIYCHTIMTSGKWTEEACSSCHGTKDGVNVGSGAPGYSNLSSSVSYTFEDYSGGGGAHYTHVTKRGYACHTCHYDGGGDGNAANHHNLSQRTVYRANVNVGVHPQYWFNNKTSYYDKTTRSCNNVKCHFGSSQNWDCSPLH